MVSFSTSVVNKFSIKDVWHYLLSNIDIKVKCEVENKKNNIFWRILEQEEKVSVSTTLIMLKLCLPLNHCDMKMIMIPTTLLFSPEIARDCPLMPTETGQVLVMVHSYTQTHPCLDFE